jgi:hypothetical protein
MTVDCKLHMLEKDINNKNICVNCIIVTTKVKVERTILLFLFLLICLHIAVVLNEKQRLAKRRLIEENRERRRMEHTYVKNRNDSLTEDVEPLSDDDKRLIEQVTTAYPYPMELDVSFIRVFILMFMLVVQTSASTL